MQQAIWKLTALGVVVGVGVLVVVQAQRGLNLSQNSAAPEGVASTGEDDANKNPFDDDPPPAEFDPDALGEQSEPEMAWEDHPGSNNKAVPASAKTSPASRRAKPAVANDDDFYALEEDTPPAKRSSRNSPSRLKAPPADDEAEPEMLLADDPPAKKPATSRSPEQDDTYLSMTNEEDAADALPETPTRGGKKNPGRLSSSSPKLRSRNEMAADDAGFPGLDQEETPSPRKRKRPSDDLASAPRLKPINNEEPELAPETEFDDAESAPAVPSSKSEKQSAGSSDDADEFPFPGRAVKPSRLKETSPKTNRGPVDDESAETPSAGDDDDLFIERTAPVKRSAQPRAIDEDRAAESDTTADEDSAEFSTRERTPERPSLSRNDKPGRTTGEPFGEETIDDQNRGDAAGLGTQPAKKSTAPGLTRPSGDDASEFPAASKESPATLGRDDADDDADFGSKPRSQAPEPEQDEAPRLGSVPAPSDDDESISLPGKSSAAPPALEPERRPARNDLADEMPATSRPKAPSGPKPKLSIRKVAPPTAVLGKPMVYQILVRNSGPVAAHQVLVEDTIPEGVTLDGSIPQAQTDGRKLVWKLGTLEPDAEKKISVKVIPESEGTVGSVATVNYSPDARPNNPNAPKLQFDLIAPQQATLGTPITFRFKVVNVGRREATGVVIRDVLPAALRHPDGDDLEYEVGLLPPGETREVELSITAAQAGRTVNRAVVTADGNVTEESTVTVEVVGPALTVTRAGPKRLYPNKTGIFTNTVNNPLASPVPNVHLVETIPTGMDFVEATDGGEYNPNKRTVTWMFDRLGSGESKNVRITLSARNRGAQVSVVRAYDSTGASGEAMGTTHVSGVPALRVEFGELPAVVEPGEEVRVPVRLINRGTDVATNVQVTVTLPARLRFVSANAPVDRQSPGTGREAGTADRQETIQFRPIGKLEPGLEANVVLILKTRSAGSGRCQVSVTSEQLDEPIQAEERLTIARADE